MGLRDILLAAIFIGVLPLCLFRPWVGVLAWTWLGLMNPHRLSWALETFPAAKLVGAATLIGLLVARDRQSIPWNRSLILLGILFLYATATNLTAWAPEAAWAYWSRVAKIVLMIFVMTMLIHGQKRVYWLLVTVALSIGFFGFKGGLFTMVTGGQFMVQGPEDSMVSGNTFIGLAMVMVLPLLFALAREAKVKWARYGLYFTCAMNCLSIPFTYSRGALLGLAVVLPGIFPRLRRFIIVLPLLIPVAYIAYDMLPGKLVDKAATIGTYEEDLSAMSRIRSWRVAVNIALERPLTGAGFDFEEYPDPGRWHSYVPHEYAGMSDKIWVAHSIYFSILGYHGFLALGLFLAMLLFAIIDLRRLERRAAGNSEVLWIAPYARALRIGLIGYMVAGAFLNSAYFDLTYIFIGMIGIFQREMRNAERRAGQAAAAAPVRDPIVAGPGGRDAVATS